jgi:hypothetical protein
LNQLRTKTKRDVQMMLLKLGERVKLGAKKTTVKQRGSLFLLEEALAFLLSSFWLSSPLYRNQLNQLRD